MNEKKGFESLIAQKQPIILDGGLATELQSIGHDLNTPLWSAALLLDQQQSITDAHLAYLNAGAKIITTATYQASMDGFAAKGVSTDECKKLMLDAVVLAQSAVEQYCLNHPDSTPPVIAASIGPYGAFLADGSEYRGQYEVSDAVLVDFHQPRLKLLDDSAADVFACETIPSFQEAEVLAELLVDLQTPAWISFSCRDSQHLNDGTDIKQAASLFAGHANVLAIGINCTAPDYISGLVAEIKSVAPDKSIIVYPNAGQLYDAVNKSWESTTDPVFFSKLVQRWYHQGVQIIGGCCQIGPEQIKTISMELSNL